MGRLAHNQKIAGAIPAPATFYTVLYKNLFKIFCRARHGSVRDSVDRAGVAQWLERAFHKR